ncbi:MAG: ATP-binding protein [Cellvibrionaceae bacterium]
MTTPESTSAVQEAFRKADFDMRLRQSRIGCILLLVLVPAGITLDYFVYPERLLEFALIRLFSDVLLAAVLVLHYVPIGRRHIGFLTQTWLMTAVIMIAYMIYVTEGEASTYYAGITLVIVAIGILLPLTLAEVTAFSVAAILVYSLACVMHDPSDLSVSQLFNNLYFLILASVISMTAVFFSNRRRYNEFRLGFELESNYHELSQLDKLKSQFFANISHELRTPLGLILAPLQDLMSSKELSPQVRSFLTMANLNGMRLLKLVNDLLDLIRLEEGKQALELQPLKLNQLLETQVEAVSHYARLKGVSVEKHLCQEDITVVGDQPAFERIFINLLSNASKFTENGGTISVSSKVECDQVTITVEDTGVGIPARELPYIFDRFHQVDASSTRKYQGTGIGLALVKELTEKQGGEISVSSKLGRGTSMHLRFPLAEKRAYESPEYWHSDLMREAARPRLDFDADNNVHVSDGVADLHQSDPFYSAIPDPLEHINREAQLSAHAVGDSFLPQAESRYEAENSELPLLLIVDDEPGMRGYLAELLSDSYRISMANDGGLALRIAIETKPELMLLDLMLPTMDGLEVCRRLKEDEATRRTKIVLLTARVDEAAKIEALENGANDFLTKPFSSIEVRTRLQNLYRQAELEKNLVQTNEQLTNTLSLLQKAQAQILHEKKLVGLGSMAAGLLHEVQNPLSYTLTALHLLKSEKEISNNEEMADMLHDVEEGVQRVNRIVADLETFAYPSEIDKQKAFHFGEAVKLALRFTRHDLNPIVAETQLDDDDLVLGSEGHIVQVLVNLLRNCAKVLKELTEDRAPQLKITAKAMNGKLLVSVWDNGPGIDPELQSRVFEPFYTTKDVGEGMGLGLSICHTIIRNHGNELKVESEPGQWTEFSFNLSLAAESLAGQDQEELRSSLGSGQGR